MGRWTARAGAELLADAAALVLVLLHWRRTWHGRYNQSGALAAVIARQSAVKLKPSFWSAHAPPSGRSDCHAPRGPAMCRAHSACRSRGKERFRALESC
jgi:hypothetical protein